MTTIADLALIKADAPFFARAVSESEPRLFKMRDCSLTLLPLSCKTSAKSLKRGLYGAAYAGCRIAAIEAGLRPSVTEAPLLLADGRLFALSVLPRRLDLECPGWRKDIISISADDNFSCLAARWLASRITQLHVFGTDENRRQGLIRLLYRETGLIAQDSAAPKPGSLLIAPPQEQTCSGGTEAWLWQNWPEQAMAQERELIPGHLAEALLLSAGPLPAGVKPLNLLLLLKHRSLFYEILPI